MLVADYSARRMTGAELKGSGFGGALRYAGLSETNPKITNHAEVVSILNAGLQIGLVFEGGTADFTGGYNAGVANANALKNHAVSLGLPARGYLSVDQHITTAQMPVVQQYFMGAVSVLGAANTGAYGFYDSLDPIQSLRLGAYWQSGARGDIRTYTNVYQRNYVASGQVTSINGTAVDTNDILQPHWLNSSIQGRFMTNYIVKMSSHQTDGSYAIAATQDGPFVSGVTWANAASTIAAGQGSVTGLTDSEWDDRVAKSAALVNLSTVLSAKLDGVVAAIAAIPVGVATISGNVPVSGSLHLGA